MIGLTVDMKILLLGSDGYLGWALALRLASRGHEVIGVDNLFTREVVDRSGSGSALPILSPEEREAIVRKDGLNYTFVRGDITTPGLVKDLVDKHRPDVVVDFAEQRSAPFSMSSEDAETHTVVNNLVGTLRVIHAIKGKDIHFLKMGTMGEYGTPKFKIPDSPFVEAEIGGVKDLILFPRWGQSTYHMSKIFDTYLILLHNQISDLTVTDIMQGPVYGTRTKEIKDEKYFTRLDFDGTWGTVVNRFCVEAVLGLPLTVYGKGGQTRGFISLEDSVTAVTLLLERPPSRGEYRVANQFSEVRSVMEIAEMVREEAGDLSIPVEISHLENPRPEKESHTYDVEIKTLPSLGFTPVLDLRGGIKETIKELLPYRERLRRYEDVIRPRVRWRR